MHNILIPALVNVLALLVCILAILLGQENTQAPRNVGQPSGPVVDKLQGLNNNALFRFFDRIPLFRRSGKASVNDLAKALFIVLLISLLPNMLAAHSLAIALWASGVVLTVVALILLMHPFLSHRQTFNNNLRSLSPFKRKR